MWKVHKFGGTSVGDAQRYRAVTEILAREGFHCRAVIVSAMGKTTDALIHLLDLAARRDDSYRSKAGELVQQHIAALERLTPEADNVAATLESDLKDLEEILRGVWHGRTHSEQTLELVTGYGELWSAQILNAALDAREIESCWLDARQVLVVAPGPATPEIDWNISQERLHAWLSNHRERTIVITGYIAATADGIPTTLKRNGSDYSASIFGRLLGATEIVIWTDVDGIMSADPRLVPDALVLDEMSYDEATELAYFGAKVVHPNTMAPAIGKKIPIRIRNTFKPELPGTLIHAKPGADGVIKGFSTIDGIALINVEGTGMIGVPGIAERLFRALRDVGISVVMISQASSEHSICFAVAECDGVTAKAALEKEFFAAIHHGQIQRVELRPKCSILAAVGEGMVDQAGVSGKFFGALGRAGINIRAIAQGSSQRNISVVISQPDSRRALRAVHSGFYLSHQTISIGVVGAGLIGSAFLDQLAHQAELLRSRFKVDLRVRAIATSRRLLLADQKLSLTDWRGQLPDSEDDCDLGRFVDHVQVEHIPHSAIIDCTASADIASLYPDWLHRGVHVITPNKKANSGPLDFYHRLKRTANEAERHYLYETTVGAGLPIINTLRDLVKTGDRIRCVEGVLSGTLSYIFNSLDGSRRFSEMVNQAKRLGLMEPDPRDDLSGMDVARKLVILAREMGLELELDAIEVENLVPTTLHHTTVSEFLARLPELDYALADRIAAASGKGAKLRYVGRIDIEGKDAKFNVSVRSFAPGTVFSEVTGCDNLVAFHTARYGDQPLIVRGPGAGPQVTAAGVFADLLRLTSYLGAHL